MVTDILFGVACLTLNVMPCGLLSYSFLLPHLLNLHTLYSLIGRHLLASILAYFISEGKLTEAGFNWGKIDSDCDGQCELWRVPYPWRCRCFGLIAVGFLESFKLNVFLLVCFHFALGIGTQGWRDCVMLLVGGTVDLQPNSIEWPWIQPGVHGVVIFVSLAFYVLLFIICRNQWRKIHMIYRVVLIFLFGIL